MPNESRFERAPGEPVGGAKIANRGELNDTLGFEQSLSVGDFVSRLWARFGPPDDVSYEGFTYTLRDRETGLIFTAYAAGSGPAYGGVEKDALVPSIAAFERWIAATDPADCAIEYDTDFGRHRSGARDGVPFDERGRQLPAPDTATNAAECAAIAHAHAEGDELAGWARCLEAVVELDSLEIDDKDAEFIAFVPGDNDLEVAVDDGDNLVQLPISEVHWPALPPIATLWLSAYALWRRMR